ncbi:MAG: hypothetical protein NTZ05_11535 [Chloroflexi bacterium]|nr:hypothetical protein [Chloroflexota bacterium]
MEIIASAGMLSWGMLMAAPAALLLLAGPRRAGRRVLWAVKELLTSKSFVLSAGAFSLIASGAMLNNATTAFFTATTAVTGSSITSAVMNLNTPAFVAFNAQKMVPGDMFDQQISITNSSNIATPYYLTTFPTAASSLNANSATALRMIWFRCGTEAAPVACAGATTFETVSGVMNAAAATVTTSGGPPTTAGLSVSGSGMAFANGAGGITSGTQTIGGMPILTKNNTGNVNCSTVNDGGCLLGGNSSGLNNPAVTVSAGGGTINIPALSSIKGVSPGLTDRFLAYVFLPLGADQSTYGGANSVLTFGFTAVQPVGVFEPAR